MADELQEVWVPGCPAVDEPGGFVREGERDKPHGLVDGLDARGFIERTHDQARVEETPHGIGGMVACNRQRASGEDQHVARAFDAQALEDVAHAGQELRLCALEVVQHHHDNLDSALIAEVIPCGLETLSQDLRVARQQVVVIDRLDTGGTRVCERTEDVAEEPHGLLGAFRKILADHEPVFLELGAQLVEDRGLSDPPLALDEDIRQIAGAAGLYARAHPFQFVFATCEVLDRVGGLAVRIGVRHGWLQGPGRICDQGRP